MGRDTIRSRRRLPRLNSFASSLIAVTEFRVAFPMTTAESLRLRPRCRSRSRCRETRRSGCSRSSRSWSQVSSENAQDVWNDVTKNSPQENSQAILRLFSRQSGKTKKARSRHKVGSGEDLRGMTLDGATAGNSDFSSRCCKKPHFLQEMLSRGEEFDLAFVVSGSSVEGVWSRGISILGVRDDHKTAACA